MKKKGNPNSRTDSIINKEKQKVLQQVNSSKKFSQDIGDDTKAWTKTFLNNFYNQNKIAKPMWINQMGRAPKTVEQHLIYNTFGTLDFFRFRQIKSALIKDFNLPKAFAKKKVYEIAMEMNEYWTLQERLDKEAEFFCSTVELNGDTYEKWLNIVVSDDIPESENLILELGSPFSVFIEQAIDETELEMRIIAIKKAMRKRL